MAINKESGKAHVRPADASRDENTRRVTLARRAVIAFRNDDGLTDVDGLDTAITDLVCDLNAPL